MSQPTKKPMVVPPAPAHRAPRRQFGMGVLFLIVSLGGPILAALLMVPPDFYVLIFSLIGIAWVFVLGALAISFLRPAWAATILTISITAFVLANVAMFTNQLRLPTNVNALIMVTAWVQAAAGIAGFFISMARHAH